MSENLDELFDQRYYRRVTADGQVRINFGGRWNDCQTVNISGGGGCFRSRIKPLMGSSVLIHLRGQLAKFIHAHADPSITVVSARS